MGWRGIVDHPTRTVFFWSQKAGCTTLFEMLGQNMPSPRPPKKRVMHRSRDFATCLQPIRNHGYASVAVVRHPVSRIVSAYINKFCVHREVPLGRHDQLEDPYIRPAHLDICAHAGRCPDLNLTTFEEFLAFVERDFATRPTSDTPVNGHWDTQVPPALFASDFRYNTVLHVENLTEELAALTAILGMSYDLSAHNRTRTRPGPPHSGYLGNQPGGTMHQYAFTTANFVNNATLAAMRRLYAMDFAMFDYAPLPEDVRLSQLASA